MKLNILNVLSGETESHTYFEFVCVWDIQMDFNIVQTVYYIP